MPQTQLSRISQTEIIDILEKAKQHFLASDIHLLDVNANERSLTHKFAEYIQQEFEKKPGNFWKVDCEYNRYGYGPKVTPKIVKDLKYLVSEDGKVDVENTDARTVYPDIIVHKRGPKGPNIMVIEAKKASRNSDEIDKDKRKLTKIKKEYKYEHAIFLKFNTERKTVNWEFINSTASRRRRSK